MEANRNVMVRKLGLLTKRSSTLRKSRTLELLAKDLDAMHIIKIKKKPITFVCRFIRLITLTPSFKYLCDKDLKNSIGQIQFFNNKFGKTYKTGDKKTKETLSCHVKSV